MCDSVEFWSSVEYGTFLKGLVRELGAEGEMKEGRSGRDNDGSMIGDGESQVSGGLKARGGESGTQGIRNGGEKTDGETCPGRNEGRVEEGNGEQMADGRTPIAVGGRRLPVADISEPQCASVVSHNLMSARQRFAVSESDYRQARGKLARLRMRLRCYVGYPSLLHRRIRREAAPAALVVCTNTFYAPWVAMRSARKRGIPVVHWMFDLYPDVLVLAGKLRPGSLGERWLRRWVRAMFDGAAANVFLGERLLAYAEAKFGPIPSSIVIPVGCDAAPFAEWSPAERPAGAPVGVLYCGNFGRMHEVDTVVAVLRGGLPVGVRFDFRGNGAGFQTLATATAGLGLGEQLRLGGSLPEREWLDAMAAADVALVTMKRGAEGIVMPSKTYSAMAAGQAILAVAPRESDLSDLVAAHDCGWVVEPGDVAGLRSVLDLLALRGADVLAKRRNAWRAARECYDQRLLAGRWREVLRGCAKP